jgi:hypothetical protein
LAKVGFGATFSEIHPTIDENNRIMKKINILIAGLVAGMFLVLGMPTQATAQSGCWKTLDFSKDASGNTLAAGVAITDQFAGWGINLEVRNNNRKHPNAAIVFDSSNPTGGDIDLGTPNEAHNGPGKGEGGASNDRALGNLLIIAENDTDADGDALIDAPDDEASGGDMVFRFDGSTKIRNLVMVDLDKNETGAVLKFTKVDGTAFEVPLVGTGDNCVARFAGEWSGVQLLTITFTGSGAIASMEFCQE